MAVSRAGCSIVTRREPPSEPLHHVAEAVEFVPEPPDHPQARVADGGPRNLSAKRRRQPVPGSQAPPVDPAVEFADGAPLRPCEVGAADPAKGGTSHCRIGVAVGIAPSAPAARLADALAAAGREGDRPPRLLVAGDGVTLADGVIQVGPSTVRYRRRRRRRRARTARLRQIHQRPSRVVTAMPSTTVISSGRGVVVQDSRR